MKKISEILKNLCALNRKNLYTAQISKVFGYIWGVSKFIFGLFTKAYFLRVSGIYSCAVSVSKEVFFKGRKASDGQPLQEKKYYIAICGILAFASVMYILYALRLFFFPENLKYNDAVAVVTTIVAFVELTLAIVNLTRANRRNDLLLNGLRCANLVSAFAALVFSQAAVLSLSNTMLNIHLFNAIRGVTFGSAGIVVCAYMLIKYILTNKRKEGA